MILEFSQCTRKLAAHIESSVTPDWHSVQILKVENKNYFSRIYTSFNWEISEGDFYNIIVWLFLGIPYFFLYFYFQTAFDGTE